jgi:bifunctional non-homologous end joining protein LigD
MNEEHAHLFFKQGTSDKEYHAHLLPNGSNWSVTFEYGRRGSTLTAGTKTQVEVPYDQAKKIYDKLVAEKVAKGYQPGEGTSKDAVLASEDKVIIADMVPQLPTMIEEEELEAFIQNNDYIEQEKFDGKHMMVQAREKVIATNKRGIMIGFPMEVRDGILALQEATQSPYLTLDGEAIGTVLHVFDVLECGGRDLRYLGYEDRYKTLFQISKYFDGSLSLVYAASGIAAKRNLLKEIRARRGEGVVFKLKTAPYTPGKPGSGGTMRKFKFYGEATCQVLDITKGKRSVSLGVTDLNMPSELRYVGKVTVPPNHPMPKQGSLVDVKYLYAYPGGALFQAVYKGPRDDVKDPDKYTSLKFKADTLDDDDGA